MLVRDKFKAGRKPVWETVVGALAVSGSDYPSSIASAVSIARIDAERERVSYRISYYTEPEDVADPETGDFLPGIEATPHSDWSIEVQLLTDDELPGALAEAESRDFSFSIPVPELGLTLFGSGHTG